MTRCRSAAAATSGNPSVSRNQETWSALHSSTLTRVGPKRDGHPRWGTTPTTDCPPRGRLSRSGSSVVKAARLRVLRTCFSLQGPNTCVRVYQTHTLSLCRALSLPPSFSLPPLHPLSTCDHLRRLLGGRQPKIQPMRLPGSPQQLLWLRHCLCCCSLHRHHSGLPSRPSTQAM